MAQTVKNPSAIQKTGVRSLGCEDPLEGRHGNPLQYSCLENPHGQKSLVDCSPRGHKKSDVTEQLSAAQYAYPFTSWQIKGEKVEVVTEFLFLGSKTTADGDCSHEMRRQLLLGRKAMTNLDSVLKSRDVTLPAKICIVKAMVFPLVTYGCESWTVKKAECQRVDAFEL